MDTPSKKRRRKREPANRLISEPAMRATEAAERASESRFNARLSESSLPEAARQWVREFVHEINQPLASLLTSAQACRRLCKTPKRNQSDVHESLDRVVFLAERVSAIVAQLRDQAVLTPGSTPSHVHADLHAVLRNALRVLEDRTRAEKIKIELHFAKDIPTVRGDEASLGQVALNLLRNACDSMRQTKPNQRRLTLTTRREGDVAETLIRDTGSGISLDVVDRLFEPLSSSKPEGMGIGLAISREIIQGLGGSMSARSHPDQGSVFSFTVPLSEKNE